MKPAIRDAPIGRPVLICSNGVETQGKEKTAMLLRFAFAFLVIALIAALFGFTNIAAAVVGKSAVKMKSGNCVIMLDRKNAPSSGRRI